MELPSAINNILSGVEKHSGKIGAGIALLQRLSPTSAGTIQGNIQLLLSGSGHAPEWGNIINFATADTDTMNSLILGIAGYFTKGLTGNRYLNAASEIAQKLGTAYFAVSMFNAALFYSTHSPSGNMAGMGGLPQQVGGYTSTPLSGSTLNQTPGTQPVQNYQTVYTTQMTAGSLYTVSSGQRPIGN